MAATSAFVGAITVFGVSWAFLMGWLSEHYKDA
jgi:hypothetical protein